MKNRCHVCGHTWESNAKTLLVTCSSCGRKTPNQTLEIKKIIKETNRDDGKSTKTTISHHPNNQKVKK